MRANLLAHKVAAIPEAIEAVAARLVFLCPYSPEFNPIEKCWSKVKEFFCSRAARTYSELDEAITKAIATITSQDIIGWFTHCCYYILSN